MTREPALPYTAPMPLTSDIILDRLSREGYSMSEAAWNRSLNPKFYFEVTAEKNGHRHITRAPDREHPVVRVGLLTCIR